MAVNQAQVDPLLPSVSADDTKVKLQQLQDDVDLIKVSIKRLLIDIRERMNELENPFVSDITLSSSGQRQEVDAAVRTASPTSEISSMHSTTSGSSLSIPTQTIQQILPDLSHNGRSTQNTTPHPQIARLPDPQPDERYMKILRSQGVLRVPPKGDATKQGQEKLRLTKVHRLFEWTSRMVKKYGHDRLDVMLQSYRVMGYINRESGDQVKEIARLMPPFVGESPDISPDEFIKELYTLNRILDPSDMSLDRDMIEVLMELHRRSKAPSQASTSMEKEPTEDWVRMFDGV